MGCLALNCLKLSQASDVAWFLSSWLMLSQASPYLSPTILSRSCCTSLAPLTDEVLMLAKSISRLSSDRSSFLDFSQVTLPSFFVLGLSLTVEKRPPLSSMYSYASLAIFPLSAPWWYSLFIFGLSTRAPYCTRPLISDVDFDMRSCILSSLKSCSFMRTSSFCLLQSVHSGGRYSPHSRW